MVNTKHSSLPLYNTTKQHISSSCSRADYHPHGSIFHITTTVCLSAGLSSLGYILREHIPTSGRDGISRRKDIVFFRQATRGPARTKNKTKLKITNNMAQIILPEEKMARYIKYCQEEQNNKGTHTMCCCPNCNKIVEEGPQYPYYYDEENNDVYFASLCPKCGGLMISKE